MELFYLGHAGFLVTHRDRSVVIDPWLSANGAFNRAWYQFPRNHHLHALLDEKVAHAAHARIVVSHEHADHFCRDTLSSDALRSVGIVVPDYRTKSFRDAVRELRERPVAELPDREELRVGALSISFVIDDSGLDRDAGILVRSDDGSTFLNYNDCKAFEQLPGLREQLGGIDIFACQFSGAIRHPICYEYDERHYAQVSRDKRRAKYETVRAAIDAVDPRLFLPTAGPCAFLDPALFHLNFAERGEIFAKSWDYAQFLRETGCDTPVETVMPGDTLRWDSRSIEIAKVERVVSAATFADYMRQYQRDCWRPPDAPRAKSRRLERLFLADLTAKVRLYRRWAPRISVAQTLYFELPDAEPSIKVDFGSGDVVRVAAIDDAASFLYRLSWEDIAALYDDGLGWGGHTLTFRFSIRRNPDVYDRIIDLFLTSTVEEFRDGLRYLDDVRRETETIDVAAADGQRFRIRRYCPHQGADLLGARIEGREVVCPRHGWRFDLNKGGACDAQGCDIAARPV